MIIDRPVNMLTYTLFKRDLMPHKNIRMMRYGIYAIYSEVVKLIFLLMLFALTKKLNEFLFALVILLVIRSYSGGLHFKSFMGCFLFTVGFFILNVAILPSVSYINNPSNYIVLLPICSFIVYLYSPMPSIYRPISSKKRIKKLKYMATILTTFIYIALLVTNCDPIYKSIGIWTIVLQSIQLLISGGIQKWKKNSKSQTRL